MIDCFPACVSLRAFTAAARRLSFSKAAEDMGVTPAAISHQIKEIEDQLRVSLFIRNSRCMILTQEGEILATAARKAWKPLAAPSNASSGWKTATRSRFRLRPPWRQMAGAASGQIP